MVSPSPEAPLEQEPNHNGEPAKGSVRGRISRFGSTTDAAEAGRRGGIASGRSRRLRELTVLESKIIASSNGAAAMKLLETKRRDAAELLREQRRADELVSRLMDEADLERETIAGLRQERRELLERVSALSHREEALKAAVDAGEAELVAKLSQLAALDEHKFEELLSRIDGLELVDDDAAA